MINTIATYLIGRYANTPKKQKKVMVLAGVCHIIVFASLILLPIASLKCKPDHPSPCDWLRGTAETPSLLDIAYIFALVFFFAIGDAVWESQIPAYLQSVFSESDNDTNAAMSNLKMWQSLGFALQFALGIKGMPLFDQSIEYSAYICAGILLVGLLGLSMILK